MHYFQSLLKHKNCIINFRRKNFFVLQNKLNLIPRMRQ